MFAPIYSALTTYSYLQYSLCLRDNTGIQLIAPTVSHNEALPRLTPPSGPCNAHGLTTNVAVYWTRHVHLAPYFLIAEARAYGEDVRNHDLHSPTIHTTFIHMNMVIRIKIAPLLFKLVGVWCDRWHEAEFRKRMCERWPVLGSGRDIYGGQCKINFIISCNLLAFGPFKDLYALPRTYLLFAHTKK